MTLRSRAVDEKEKNAQEVGDTSYWYYMYTRTCNTRTINNLFKNENKMKSQVTPLLVVNS